MGTTIGAAMFSANQTVGANNKFFDKEIGAQDNFQRDPRFDQSNALGWSDDKLGRLAEINKTQLETALRDMNNFARTDAGFHRQVMKKGSATNNRNRLNPIVNKNGQAARHFSPQKVRTENSAAISSLRLDKQPASSTNAHHMDH